MSAYAVNKVCHRVVHDEAFRAALRDRPAQALRDLDPPLTDAERDALLTGEVGRLSRLGANDFLLSQLVRLGVLGISAPDYERRMKAAYPPEQR